MSTIRVFSTGGTIACVKDPETGKVRVAVSGDELLGELRDVSLSHEVEVESVCSLPSWDMDHNRRLELAESITGFLERPEATGAVVTHGTDSLEETAYFLHKTVDSEKPIVVTGAMRNQSELGFEGHQNLYHALLVAGNPNAKNRGTLAVLNDEIHSARWVAKRHTTRTDTFESVNAGPVGILNDYTLVFYGPPLPRSCFSLDALDSKSEEDVMLIKTFSGMSDRLVRFALDEDVQGLVVEGTGSGNVPTQLADDLEEALDRGIPVVVVSRCWDGAPVPIYGMDSGGETLREMGVIHASWLNGQKARVHLMLALSQGLELDEIRASYDRPDESLA